FNHTGGTHPITGDMRIGDLSTGVGTYTIDGSAGMPTAPMLDMQNLIVGAAGKGTFTINDAGATVRGNLIVGQSSTGDGTVNVTAVGGPSSLAINGSVSIGTVGDGKMTVTGSTVNIAGALIVGSNGLFKVSTGGVPTISGDVVVDGGAATLMIQAGFMTSQGVGTAPVVIADAGFGVVRHTGGTHVVTGDMTIGKLAGSIGEYTLDQTTGSSLLQAHHVFVGKAGNGLLRLDAGDVDLSGSLYVGNSAGGVGNATFGGGTCDITGSAWVGGQGAGEMTVSGNSAVTVTGNVNLADSTSSSGALTLSGGSLSVGGNIMGGYGTSSFTYGGGTLSVAGHSIQAGEINVKGGQSVTWTTGDNITCAVLNIGDGTAGKLVNTGGVLNVSQSVWIDYAGAWVVQGASDVNITNNLNIPYGAAILKGGTVDVGGNMSLEDAVVTHSNSAVNITGDLSIAGDATTAYNLLDDIMLFSPLTLACQNMKVGVSLLGLFSQDGGATTVRGDLVVGQNSTGDGTLEIRKSNILRNTVMTVQGNTQVGLSGSGQIKSSDAPTVPLQGNLDIGGPNTGFMLIDGPATVQVNGNTTVNGTGLSLLRLNDGTLTTGQNTGQTFAAGKANMGVVEHNGGTLTVRGDLILGQLAGGIGSYTMDNTEGAPHLVARHLYVGKEGNGTFSQIHGDTDLSGSLYIGHAATSTNGQCNISGGTFDVAGSAWVGVQGTGALTIFSGATVTIGQDINLADAAGASGTLTLAGGSLSVGHWIYGGQSTSIFAYKGGTLSVAGHQISAGEIRVSGGSGVTWTTSDGITASNLRVGYQQAGRMVQTGGTLNVSQDLNVGWSGADYVLQAGDANISRDLLVTSGKAEIKAGTLDIARNMTLSMAFDTTGDVEQTGGVVTILGDMAVGTLGGMGTYTLKGGTLNSGNLSPDCTYIGKDAQSIGTFDHRGGVHNVGYDFKLGFSGTARGSYVMTDDPTLAGSPSLTGLYADIGYGATGAYEQSGGSTHFVLNANVGRLAGSSGLIGVYGGDFTVDGALFVGRAGAGTLRQTGGYISVGGELAFAYDPGSTATWTLSDDPAVAGAPGLETHAQNIGRSGAAVVTQSGGFNSSGGTITLGYNAGSSGIYNLSGGTMHADDAIVVGRAGHGELLITGGTADSSGDLSVASLGGTGLVRLEAAGALHINGQFRGYTGSTFIYNGGVYTDTNSELFVEEFVLADGAGTHANWTLAAGDALNTSTIRLGHGGTATLTVNGGSVFTESQLIMAEGGKGTLTVRSGSTITLADTLDMCSLPGSTGLIDVRDSTLWVGGEAQLGQGATIKVGSAANVSIGAAVLNPGSLVRISGGTLSLPSASALTLNGGAVAFDAGTLALAGDSDLDGGFVGTVFGATQSIVSGQNLQVDGLATLQARLVLDGGRLATRSLATNGCLDFRRGTLETLGGQFVFGDAGPLGRTVVIGAGQTCSGQFGATIAAGSAVTLAGGQISTGTSALDVSGELAGSGTVAGGFHVWETGELRVGAGET
ncbi:MAG: hypothetical protein NT049_04395, partial [Planctomycetota bacterium]|nr:hypothetical protein [Planctomycetota bacterium]